MSNKVLVLILLLSLGLRVWQINSFPSGLNADEAALGYNAYSLLTTGKDEHGHPWPVNLESFGDFKPAGYAYLLMPFIKVLGLNEFAVRLPSAIFGILGVLGIYLLTKSLYLTPNPPPNLGEGEPIRVGEVPGLLSALLLAISPWHLHFSRGAWETNIATTLLVIGVWLFVKWTKNTRLSYFLLSTFLFVLSMYFYQSTRLIAPVLGVGLVVLYWKDFLKEKKQLLIGTVLGVILLLPLAYSIVKTDAASRFSGVGFLADEGPLNRARELRGQHTNPNSIFVKILHFKQGEYALRLVRNYLDHFDGNFLFINGDVIQRNKTPETGQFYLTDFLFLAIGIFFLFKTKNNRAIKIVWLWLFVSPIAAAITFQTPHALRAHNMVIPMIIIISAGFHGFFSYILNHKSYIKTICYLLFAICYIWQFGRYLHEYYVHYPKTYPTAWEYGFKELVAYVDTVKDKYSKIWVTDKYDQPYILFLFYSKYDPKAFQSNHKLTFRDKFNFSTVRDFDKYHFASVSWPDILKEKNTLIIASPDEVPENVQKSAQIINFPNGKPAFLIYEN